MPEFEVELVEITAVRCTVRVSARTAAAAAKLAETDQASAIVCHARGGTWRLLGPDPPRQLAPKKDRDAMAHANAKIRDAMDKRVEAAVRAAGMKDVAVQYAAYKCAEDNEQQKSNLDESPLMGEDPDRPGRIQGAGAGCPLLDSALHRGQPDDPQHGRPSPLLSGGNRGGQVLQRRAPVRVHHGVVTASEQPMETHYTWQYRNVRNDACVTEWQDSNVAEPADIPALNPYIAFGMLCAYLNCVPERVGYTEGPEQGKIRTGRGYGEATLFEYPANPRYQYRIVACPEPEPAPGRTRVIQI